MNELATGLSLAGVDHLDDIESKHDVRIIEHPQPGERAAGDLTFLERTYIVERPAQIFALSRFDFHENEGVVVTAYDVDFARGSVSKISVENFITALPEELAGRVFAASATNVFRRAR